MKKRTAVIGALVSLLPMGQPLVIGTGAALTSAAVMLSVPQRVKAESAVFYYKRGRNKTDDKDSYGAISDYSKAIEIDSRYANAYHWRGLEKLYIKDYYGAISDFNKTLQITPNDEMVYGSLGIAKMFMKDMKGACSDWRKASSLGYENATKWVRKWCN